MYRLYKLTLANIRFLLSPNPNFYGQSLNALPLYFNSRMFANAKANVPLLFL